MIVLSLPMEQTVKYFRRYQTLFGNRLLLYRPISQGKTQDTDPIETHSSTALLDFESTIHNCLNCALGSERTSFVFGVGNPNADMVFIGEAPGFEEDRQGEPFVGRAGQLLDKILAAIQLTRQEVYICNILKCRPPNNRDPLSTEVEQCLPYLKEQLRIINPKLIVALGRVAAKTLLGVEDSLKNMRNQVFTYQEVEMRVTYHPAALLRNPRLKGPAWEDFQMIRDRYHELTGSPSVAG
jgi:DNA polymerase